MEKQMYSAALHVRHIPAGDTLLSQAALCRRIVITDTGFLGT
jgi:hypothetical protein